MVSEDRCGHGRQQGQALAHSLMGNAGALIAQAHGELGRRFVDDGQSHVGWSPGRVNLIGEYTDLNNGYALPMAIDLGVCVVLRLNDSGRARAYSLAFDEATDFPFDAAVDVKSLPGWARYLAGVALLSRERGCDIQGFDAIVHGNVPIGGGVSSSAALSIAMTMAVQSAARWSLDGVSAALLCQEVEHRFAGVMCGIMDQLACRLGQPDHALFVNCATLETDDVPLHSRQAEFLVVDSGVPRSLHESAYNSRRADCAEAVVAINDLGHELADLSALTPELLAAVSGSLEPRLVKRCRHVVSENERVLAAHAALGEDQFGAFGQLMNSSHASLRDDFEVSVEELDFITSFAQSIDGVLGARLTGAGFGGNAIVLAQPNAISALEEKLAMNFEQRFGRTPRVHKVAPATPAQGSSTDAFFGAES